MKPSEMTDADLQLAIAEELGWRKMCCGVNPDIGHWHSPEGNCHLGNSLPNYTGDNNAAMGLLCKMVRDRKTFVGAIINYRIKSYDVTLWKISADDHIRDVKTKHDNTPKGIARAICEAWLTARRNDG